MQSPLRQTLYVLLICALYPFDGFALSKPNASPDALPVAPENRSENLAREARPMNQQAMENLIRRLGKNVEGETGALRFTFGGVSMACVSDVKHDRMRIIAPITSADALTAEQTRRMLDANYHTALDARYATSDGVVYAAFIHPLSPLTDPQLISALQQVSTLAKSFGRGYTSGSMSFGQTGTEL